MIDSAAEPGRTTPPPAPLSPRDEARVSFALQARRLGDLAYDLLPLDPDAPRGERLARALQLRERLDTLIAQAVITEREEGTTWTEIAAAAAVTKQTAHQRWSPAVARWAAAGRTALKRSGGLTALEMAVSVDSSHARHHPDGPDKAFSSGLDAVRYPGAEAAERARRERAIGVRARLAALHDEHRALVAEFTTVHSPMGRAQLLHRQSAVETERADLYTGLAELEPDHAAAHLATASESRTLAANAAAHADLLAPPLPGQSPDPDITGALDRDAAHM